MLAFSSGAPAPNGPVPTLPLNFLAGISDFDTKFGTYANEMSNLGGIYKEVYNKWINPVLGSPGSTVIDKMTKNLPSLKENIVLLYIGIYFFIIWYLTSQHTQVTVSGLSLIHKKMQDYVISRLRNWCVEEDGKAYFIDSQFLENPNPNSAKKWQAAFQHDQSFIWLASTNALGGARQLIDGLSERGVLDSKEERELRNKIYHKFLTEFKDGIDDAVQAEVKSILDKIDPSEALKKNYGRIRVIAIGDGGGTTGFFRILSRGLIFFRYEFEHKFEGVLGKIQNDASTGSINSSGLSYLDVGETADISFWEDRSTSPPPSLFLAYFGKEQSSLVSARISINSNATNLGGVTLKTAAADLDGYFPAQMGDDIYYQASPLGAQILDPSCTEMTGAFDNAHSEEICFISFTHSCFKPQVANRIHAQAFHQDNEFRLSGQLDPQLWPGPPETADLEAILFAMVDQPTSVLVANCSGGGIGRSLCGNELPFGQEVWSSDHQADDSASDPGAAAVRYSYGRIDRSLLYGQSTFIFTAHGYASKLPCTWPTWPPFQSQLPTPFIGTKAQALLADFGQYPLPLIGAGPQYNLALSAFRAFAILEAMVKRLKACADGLVVAGTLVAADRDTLNARLDLFLQTKAACPIKTGTDAGRACPPITYTLFHKYAD